MSHLQLEIGHGGSINTREIVKNYKEGFFPFGELVVKYLPAHHWLKESKYPLLYYLLLL